MRFFLFLFLLCNVVKMSATVSADSLFQVWMRNETRLTAAQREAARQQYAASLAELSAPKQLALPLATRVHNISQLLRRQWLHQYAPDAAFGELISSGTYNCVTGTALYALFFEALAIPYTVHELPTHVYAVVSPRKNPIRVECTADETVPALMDYAAKRDYVAYLQKHGHIRPQESNSLSVEELFNKYFFSQKEISLHELRAVYVDNLGLYAAKRGEMAAAIAFAQQSYTLRPTERTRYNLQVALENALADASMQPMQAGAYLVAWLSLEQNQQQKTAFLAQQFQVLGQKLLIEQDAPVAYALCYQQVLAATANADVQRQIKQLYYTAQANRSLLSANFETAFAYADSAFSLNPADLRSRQLLRDCALEAARIAYTFPALQVLGERIAAHSFLRTDAATRRIYAISLLSAAQQAFRQNDGAMGETVLQYFEAQHFVLQEAYVLGNTYWEAAACALRGQQMAAADAYIARGLQLSPNNAVLMRYQQLPEPLATK